MFTKKSKLLPLIILSSILLFTSGAFVARAQVAPTQVTVNDPGFTTNAQDIDRQWGLVKAGFTQAWSITTGSASTTVAVIDTGVDFTHQDLQNVTVVPGYDFINNKPLVGRIDSDDNGHGTLMAGILGATPNNNLGIVGTNWAISIMPIKVLNAQGEGTADTVAEGIRWAADNGANIINLSLGGAGFSDDTALTDAITYAFNKNVVIVAAAGNDAQTTGSDLDQNPVFPVCDGNGENMVIGVAATDQNDIKCAVFELRPRLRRRFGSRQTHTFHNQY